MKKVLISLLGLLVVIVVIVVIVVALQSTGIINFEIIETIENEGLWTTAKNQWLEHITPLWNEHVKPILR